MSAIELWLSAPRLLGVWLCRLSVYVVRIEFTAYTFKSNNHFFILIYNPLQFCWFGMVAERPRVSLAFSLRIFALVYCAVNCPLPPSPIIRNVLEQIPIFEDILLEFQIRFWNGGTNLYIPVGITGKGG